MRPEVQEGRHVEQDFQGSGMSAAGWLALRLADGVSGGPWTAQPVTCDGGQDYVVATPDFRAGYGLLDTNFTVKSGRRAAYVLSLGGRLLVRAYPPQAAETRTLAEQLAAEEGFSLDVEEMGTA